MSENVSATPVAETPSEVKKDAMPKVSPAQDLREIQNLLVCGIFPGQMAPAVVKAYQMLEQMAKSVEASVESK